MTTRSGHKWLVIYGPHGPYVARRDSPAATEARQQGARATKFRTLGGAWRKVAQAREATSIADPTASPVR